MVEFTREEIEQWRDHGRIPFEYRQALCDVALRGLDDRRDAERYRTKRRIDHERLKTTVVYELASDDERRMMVSAWFMSYDSAIDRAMAEGREGE